MSPILVQIKQRRKALGLKQKDMLLRIGISPQQYQRLEAKGNPRLYTLELIATGLKSELLLVPKEKLAAVKALLSSKSEHQNDGIDIEKSQQSSLMDNPWQGLLDDEE